MGRRKIYQEWKLPEPVVKIVKSLCADYERRVIVIRKRSTSDKVVRRYIEINKAIDCAFESIDAGLRRVLFDDLCHGRGYDLSQISYFVAKNTYYRNKRKVVHDIAVELSLV